MTRQLIQSGAVIGLLIATLCQGQQTDPGTAAPGAAQGVQVQARGPVHEAFAAPIVEPGPPKLVPKAPPAPINELPPDQKPAGNAIWVSGYWAWDEAQQTFLWVSGVWRVPPPGQRWVSGYWRAVGNQWQWVPGFWTQTAVAEETGQNVSYLPAPPAAPPVAPPGTPPTANTFYVPGYWVYQGGGSYAWRAGYWATAQPGYVWVPAHYSWSPAGYVFVPGYWDLTVPDRGVLYAPVAIDPLVVGPTFVYTPAYAVVGAVLLDSLFIGPCCHYYYGDYCGPRYLGLGYRSCYAYGLYHYDPLVSYARWEHGYGSGWLEGRAAAINNVTVNNITINRTVVNGGRGLVVPARDLAAVSGQRFSSLDGRERASAVQQAGAVQQVSSQRQQLERSLGAGSTARVARLDAPHVGGPAAAAAPGLRAAPLAPQSQAIAHATERSLTPATSVRPSLSTVTPQATYRASSFAAQPSFHPAGNTSMYRPSSFTSGNMFRSATMGHEAAPAWHGSFGGSGGRGGRR
jgi:hypothetical protein